MLTKEQQLWFRIANDLRITHLELWYVIF